MRKRLSEPGMRQKVGDDLWRVRVRLRRHYKVYERQATIRGTKEEARELLAIFKKELREGRPAGEGTQSGGLRTFGDLLKISQEKHDQCSPYHAEQDRLPEEGTRQASTFCTFTDRFERWLQIFETEKSGKTGGRQKQRLQ